MFEDALSVEGFFVFESVVDPAHCERLADAIARGLEGVRDVVGVERLERARELGVVRLPMLFDESFLEMLEHPLMLEIIDRTVGPTATLHLQNGFSLPPTVENDDTSDVFQLAFHPDFPRYLNGYLASVNVMLAVDAFTASNGGTLVVPGTHQRAEQPSLEYLEERAIPVECPAGSLIVFDSTLWHAAGRNRSNQDRRAINHQFTRSWLKPQIDYVRALPDDLAERLPERTRKLLGWDTRVVTSLDEYYQPAENRLYKSGQG
jgi:ectoine hydroxylase-related dioxygenase (phytanoyl-CoA dioxygenase family)